MTLLVDGSDESEKARLLLEENGVPYLILPSDDLDSDDPVKNMPAVYVPSGSPFNGSRNLFRGLREIRALFLPRFLSEKANEAPDF